MRISKRKYYMDMAKDVSRRSTCLRRKVGSIIVQNNQLISAGYNGPPSGVKHCIQCNRTKPGEDLNSCVAIHAEINAIFEALKTHKKFDTIYTTTEPCFYCSKLIVASGIKTIIYLDKYPINQLCIDFLELNCINKEQY